MSVLMNIRVPEELKDTFHGVCKENHTYMTTEIIRFIKTFVIEQSKVASTTPKRPCSHDENNRNVDPDKLERWGNLVKDPLSKTWVNIDDFIRFHGR